MFKKTSYNSSQWAKNRHFQQQQTLPLQLSRLSEKWEFVHVAVKHVSHR